MKKSNLALTKFKPFIITTIVIIIVIIMNHEVDGNENVKKKRRLDYKQNNNTAGASHIFVYISSKSIARLGDKTS